MRSFFAIVLTGLTVVGLLVATRAPDVAAQAAPPQVEVEDAWARVPAEGANTTTVYLDIINRGESGDRLVGASSSYAEKATIATYEHAGYNMKLKTLQGVKVKPMGRVRMRPNANFIQLENLTQPIRPGMSVPVTLRFETAGTVEVQARVSNQLLGNLRTSN